MDLEYCMLTEKTSGDEYFYEIDTVASVVKLGPTNIQEFGNGF